MGNRYLKRLKNTNYVIKSLYYLQVTHCGECKIISNMCLSLSITIIIVCAMSTKEKPQMPIVVNMKKMRLDTINQYT